MATIKLRTTDGKHDETKKVLHALAAAGLLVILEDDSVVPLNVKEIAEIVFKEDGKIKCVKYLMTAMDWSLSQSVRWMQANNLWGNVDYYPFPKSGEL